jgi:hypothetical protein
MSSELYHSDFPGFLKVFREEVESQIDMLTIASNKLFMSGLASKENCSFKDLYDFTNDLRYCAERRYKAKNNVEDEESAIFLSTRMEEVLRERFLEDMGKLLDARFSPKTNEEIGEDGD